MNIYNPGLAVYELFTVCVCLHPDNEGTCRSLEPRAQSLDAGPEHAGKKHQVPLLVVFVTIHHVKMFPRFISEKSQLVHISPDDARFIIYTGKLGIQDTASWSLVLF